MIEKDKIKKYKKYRTIVFIVFIFLVVLEFLLEFLLGLNGHNKATSFIFWATLTLVMVIIYINTRYIFPLEKKRNNFSESEGDGHYKLKRNLIIIGVMAIIIFFIDSVIPRFLKFPYSLIIIPLSFIDVILVLVEIALGVIYIIHNINHKNYND